METSIIGPTNVHYRNSRKENGDEFVGYGNEHNWTHKCALWELPYAKALILMHNIDVMHREHNVGESILSTCMAFAEKTKDNHKVRKDLAQLCNQPSLELKSSGGKSCTPFCLKPKGKKRSIDLVEKSEISRWIRRWFQESCEFEIRKTKWSKKS
jgi:hypothetical protein